MRLMQNMKYNEIEMKYNDDTNKMTNKYKKYKNRIEIEKYKGKLKSKWHVGALATDKLIKGRTLSPILGY